MAQEGRWRGHFGAMLAGVAAGVFLAPIILPALSRWGRPATKAAIKAGMAVYQRGREAAAELRETVEDVAAEIEAEQSRSDAPSSTRPQPRSEVEAETAATAKRTAMH
jgi:hypothetical protein